MEEFLESRETEAKENQIKKKKSGWKSVRKIPLKNPTIQTKKRCRKQTRALWW